MGSFFEKYAEIEPNIFFFETHSIDTPATRFRPSHGGPQKKTPSGTSEAGIF